MISNLILATVLAGSFDASFSLGGATPFGNLEAYHSPGLSVAGTVGYDQGRSHLELANELVRLPGRGQPDYTLTDYQVSLGYHYALVNKLDWQLRGGLGLDWNNLRRRLEAVSEHGSVLGPSLAFTYLRRFGHPQFLFQLAGSELMEVGHQGKVLTLVGSTMLGFRLGVGYEF
jgi:hypothetical protein